MNTSVADIRKDYKLQTLSESDVLGNPIDQFEQWWNEAVSSQIEEVNAMTLATSSKDGMPSARIVLLKDFSQEGFTFFTNYNSDKGRQLLENPKACLVFFWKELERQIRIQGTVGQVDAAISDAYFLSRPEGSQLGAWASPQSSVIDSRQVIEHNAAHYANAFANKPITRPAHWGGYIVKPQRVEFWQGRSSRLHDRIVYTAANDTWKIARLAP